MSLDETPPVASLDYEWLTVNGAARRLGVTATAIRNRIKRGTLETRPNGNFGRLVRVPVPVSVPEPVTLTPPEPVTPTVSEPVTETVRVLTRHMERLGKALDEANERAERADARAADRDRIAADWDTIKIQLDALQAVLAVERQGREDLRAERDRLLAELNRPWWRKIIR